jgi:hypothetical protein
MRDGRWKLAAPILAGLAASLLAGGTALAAETAKPGKPAKVEPIPGSDLKRVILIPKAAERLAIGTGVVGEEPVMRWLMVEGTVEVMPGEPSLALGQDDAPPAVGVVATRVRVHVLSNLDQGLDDSNRRMVWSLKDDDDDDDDDKGKDDDDDDKGRGDDDDDKAKRKSKDGSKGNTPAIVIPIGRDGGPARLPAKPIQVTATEGTGKSALSGTVAEDYEVSRADHGLRPGQRVQVKVPHPDSGKPQKVIPYAAVLYDPHGNTWTYTNPEPLVFVRHRIEVEFIEGDRAVLREGPAVGTTVVTAGAAELFGVEQKFGQ